MREFVGNSVLLRDRDTVVTLGALRLSPVALILWSAIISNAILALVVPRGDWNSIGETVRVSASIATGHGFGNPFRMPTGPSALVPPVYAYLLAGIFWVFGVYTVAAYWAAVAFNIAVHALACVTLFWSVKETFGHRTGLYAGMALATFPLVFYPLVLMHIVGGFQGEGLFIAPNAIWNYYLLELAILVLLLLTLRRVHWAVYGIGWGIAGLIDPNALAVAPAFLAWQLLQRERWRHVVRTTLVATACIMPWLVRDYLVFHHFFFIRDNFGLELRLDNYPASWDDLHPESNRKTQELAKVVTMGEFAYCRVAGQQAIAWIRAHPKEYARKTVMRIVHTWFGFPAASRRLHALKFLKYVPQALLSLLALFGTAYAVQRRNREAFLFIAVLIFCPLVHYFTHVEINYQWPIQPEMIALAAFSVIREKAPKPIDVASSRTAEYA